MIASVLITGGLGFQGLHLALALREQGRHVMVFNTPSARARARAPLAAAAGIPVLWGSVHEPETLEKVLPGFQGIVHMAAWASVDVSLERPWPPFEINAEGTYALLEAIRRFNPAARVVVASSCEVYGPTTVRPDRYTYAHPDGEGEYVLRQDEQWPLLPRSPYAATKIAADRFAYAYAVTYQMDLAILRPCNVYGPLQRSGAAGAVIPTFTQRALAGAPLTITGGGQQFREFLHVTDLVRAYQATLDGTTAPGATFNVGSGETRTIEAVAQAIVAREPGSTIEYGGARVADVSGFLLDSSQFMTRFGWAPTVKFESGLDMFLAWAREEGRAWL
jgi:dTDP-glucose 4,6-dehydratase